MSIHQYLIYIEDLLHPHGKFTSKALFGGYALYREGIIFAIITESRLYFKVDDRTKPEFEAVGSEPFVYEGKHGQVTMSYMTVPDSILENSEELPLWIDKACAVSSQSKKSKKAPRAKKRSTPRV